MCDHLSVYLHIPYCVKKCLYCDFLSYPLGKCGGDIVETEGDTEYGLVCQEGIPDTYFRRLLTEVREESLRYTDRMVDSVFIGGGTPSLLSPRQTESLLENLSQSFRIRNDVEITIEANPGTLTKEKLMAYRDGGINRLSLGLQSVSDHELRLLGRIHRYDDFLKSYDLARNCGFQNINIDLMSGLPGQTLDHWVQTLHTVLMLEPEHISAYGLIIEEGTPFFDKYGSEKTENQSELPSEEAERDMYHATSAMLNEYGYRQYEISNYAKAGYECRHNIGYWIRKDYVGFGLGAASMVDNVRWKNTSIMEEYISASLSDGDSIKQEVNILSKREQMEEYIFLGLRLNDGVSVKEFFKTFGTPVYKVYGSWIDRMVNEKLLSAGGNLCLTKKGRDLANYVMAGFLE